jgi:hypothetical protein
MATNFNLTCEKKGLWTIKFVLNENEIVWSGNNEKEILALYHTLAKKVNKWFGTHFVYSEDDLKKYSNYEHTNYQFNIQKSNYSEVYTLFATKDEYPYGGGYRFHTLSTYEEPHIYVPKEDIIEITRLFGEWLSNNDIHRMTYEVLKKDWLFHIGLGVRGNYLDTFYKDLYEVDVDFSTESITSLRNKKGKEILDNACKDALTLRTCDNTYIKFEFEHFRNNGLTFYIYNGVDSYILRFPRLDEMKKNEDFLKALKVYVYNEKVDEWVNSECDLPTFSLDNFLLCEKFAYVTYLNK